VLTIEIAMLRTGKEAGQTRLGFANFRCRNFCIAYSLVPIRYLACEVPLRFARAYANWRALSAAALDTTAEVRKVCAYSWRTEVFARFHFGKMQPMMAECMEVMEGDLTKSKIE
jgi:hypothetical protein